MGKAVSAANSEKHIDYFSGYSFPYLVLNSENVICDANAAFLTELQYSKEELFGVKSITDISISASQNKLGIIDPLVFLNNKKIKISAFIALKQKDGKLRYFFFQMNKAGKGKKILFLFEHSKQLENISGAIDPHQLNPLADVFPGVLIFFDRNFVVLDLNVLGDLDLVRAFDLKPGKRIEDTKAPDSLKKLSLDALKNCRKTGKKTEFEYSLIQNEVLRHFRFRVVPENDRIIALISDVTEEKNALQELIESRKELRDLIDEMPVAVSLISAKGNIVFMNSPFVQLIKRAGIPVSDNICGYIDKKLFKILKANGNGVKTHCSPLGKLYVDITSRVRTGDNEVQNIISFVDVTEREKTKQALEESYQKHKVLVDTSPNGIMIRDFSKVHYANPEALRILGFKKAKEVDLSKVMGSEDLRSIGERLSLVMNGGDVEYTEYTITPVDTMKPITIVTKPILINFQGKPAFQIVFRNNSSEKLLMEERLKKQLLESHNRKLKAEIARRIEIEGKHKKTIDENKLLINEVHHRVKNNYQIISSLLNGCSSNISDPASLKAISEVKNRLISMAIVNDFYMDAENYNSILLINYLKKIYQNFVRENGSASIVEKVKFETSIRNLVVNLNDAVPIGLIFNEILTILYQLVDKLSDNFCNFVSLKWQDKTNLMFTVRFHKDLSKMLEQKFESSPEHKSLTDLLEQVDGYMLCRFENAELQLIVKLSKIN